MNNSKEKEEDETGAAKTTFQSLPTEIILNVLSRLPISSLVPFKYTCRAWSMLAQNPDLLHLCLIFHCDYPIRNHLYFLDFFPYENECNRLRARRIHTPFSDLMPEYDLVGSCSGFLCLSDSLYHNSFYIYNPFKRDCIELPKSVHHHYPNQEVACGFGFHPETKQYKVVKITYQRKRNRNRNIVPQSNAQILTLGDSEWRSLGELNHCPVQWAEQVLVNGRLHWVAELRRSCAIVSLDLADEKFRHVPKPHHDHDGDGLMRSCSHLMVLRGCCLGAVFKCSNGTLEIWAMKEYGVKDSWVMEFNIPIHLLQEPQLEVNPCFKISRLAGQESCVRVLCLLDKSEVLLEYKSRVLVVYDAETEEFRNVVFEGVPKWFQTAVHVCNFNPIASLF